MPLTAKIGDEALTDDQVDHIYQWLCQDVLPAFGISAETAQSDIELWDNLRLEINAAAQLDQST